MSTLMPSLLGIVWSVTTLGILIRFDRKRQRTQKIKPVELPKPLRQILWLALLVPAIVFAVVGNFSALTNWAGAVTVIGWGIAFYLPKASSS